MLVGLGDLLVFRRSKRPDGGRHARPWQQIAVEPCIAAFRAIRLTAEQRLERRAPSGSERLNVQRVLQPVAWMISEIEKRVDVGDSHSICRLTDFYDFVSSAYRAFPQNAQVESGPAARCQ